MQDSLENSWQLFRKAREGRATNNFENTYSVFVTRDARRVEARAAPGFLSRGPSDDSLRLSVSEARQSARHRARRAVLSHTQSGSPSKVARSLVFPQVQAASSPRSAGSAFACAAEPPMVSFVRQG